MEELERELGEDFEIRRLLVPTDEREVVPSPFEREGLSVSADTVKARLAPMRAVLFQRERAPFTRKDLPSGRGSWSYIRGTGLHLSPWEFLTNRISR